MMIKLIAGLGNPGREYEQTRHNAGFWVIERLLAQNPTGTGAKRKFHGLVDEVSAHGERIVLLRPQTFMNLSGQSVAEAVRYLNVDPGSELLVVYDDLDLPVGRIRLREKGSSGGHNGIKSVISHIGGDGFARIRVGVGRPSIGVTVIDHVLSRFAKAERQLVDEAVERAAEAAWQACSQPFPVVMNHFNESVQKGAR